MVEGNSTKRYLIISEINEPESKQKPLKNRIFFII